MADSDRSPEYTVMINREDASNGIYVGAEFDSFEDFERAFKHWCAERNERFSILNSQTVHRVNKRLRAGEESYNPVLRYKSAHYLCVHGGRSRGHADSDKKYWNKRAEKLGCPACFTISVTKDRMDKLVIRRMNLDHNHDNSYEEDYSFDGFFARERGQKFNDSDLDVASNAEVQAATDVISEVPDDRKDESLTASPIHEAGGPPQSQSIVQRSINHRPRPYPNSRSLLPHYKRSKVMSRTPFMTGSRKQNGSFNRAEDEESSDEEDHFCRGLATKLRKLDPEKRSRARLQIQTILHNLEFGESAASVPISTV